MYTVQELIGPAGSTAEAEDLNSGAGNVVGGTFNPPDFTMDGTIWNETGQTLFTAPAGSWLYGINGNGDAVGMTNFPDSISETAALVRGGAVTDLSATVGKSSVATDINDNGLVCGWRWVNGNTASFVYESIGGTVNNQIDHLPGQQGATALAINRLGDVVGTSGSKGFCFSGGALIPLGDASFVEDINDLKLVCGSVGAAYPANFTPGVWDASAGSPSFTPIGLPAGFIGGHASGVNNHGDVVGSAWTAQTYEGDQSAYIHSGGVTTDLNTLIEPGSGWRLVYATKINDEGHICGYGTIYGQRAGFCAIPITVPPGGRRVRIDELVAVMLLGGVINDGGGIAVLPGGTPVPVGPWGPIWGSLQSAKRDALIGLALDELARNIGDAEMREAARRSVLEQTRSRVDSLLSGPLTGVVATFPTAAPLVLNMGKPQAALTKAAKTSPPAQAIRARKAPAKTTRSRPSQGQRS